MKVKEEIKFIVAVIGASLSCLAYVHSVFYTRTEARQRVETETEVQREILGAIRKLDNRVYELGKELRD